MTRAPQLSTTLRTFLAVPLTFFVTLYCVALTCSMAGMEITGWTSVLFFLLYLLFDRLSHKHNIEMHTLGVELPVFLLLIFVIIGLRVNAPEANTFLAMGNLRNLVLLFAFTYSLQVVRNLNRLMAIIATCGTFIAIYAIWQHFSGVDLWRQSHRALQEIPGSNGTAWASVGFFSHHLTFGHSYMMILCLPFAALLLARRPRWWQLSLYLFSFSVILLSLIFSYGRGVWIAVAVALPIMAFFASRKLFISAVITIALVAGIAFKVSPIFHDRMQSILAENYQSNDDRRKLWRINLEMFHDHPWFGVGFEQNESRAQEYYQRLGIADGFVGHAHSNYMELLGSTGILGFLSYMLFILAYILMTARLLSQIPSTHYWHRVFALAALGAQIAFHVGGLTQWNFGDAEVQQQFLFWLAVVGYMSQRYTIHIVPDDHSL